MVSKDEINELRGVANEIRRLSLEMIAKSGAGHPGGSLSITDVITALYFKEMRLDPANPLWEDRDRLVLSKGHASPPLYVALAKRGLF